MNEIIEKLNTVLLGKDNRINLYPAKLIKNIPLQTLREWCSLNAIYTLPTIELIQWLKGELINANAIEVGSGNSDIGYHLGIKQTDSYAQTHGLGLAYNLAYGECPTLPREDVERIDANEAIIKYKPDLVIASFLTQVFEEGDEENKIGSSLLGVREIEIIKQGKYIHIGNENVHGDKRILEYPHTTFRPPWLVTRCADQSKNVIYIWDKL
jgi:hypothetical protein